MFDSGMRQFAHIPECPSEARVKLREGLADWWRFVASAPCLAICWSIGRGQVFAARAKAFAVRHRAMAAVLRVAAKVLRWLIFLIVNGYAFELIKPSLNTLLGI